LARARHAAGASDLLELLDAQRTAQQSQAGLVEGLAQQRQALVGVLRALGASASGQRG
jgi:outer membrane protein TolC